ncbi:hypothetical protein GOP47_0004985 [Adiantum capillus-veneris]|uniref:TIR domain-containing protein n=1 Tax=Adiantum capillus-veneris TaxID=13818 RepID=A0A9D4V552_ADICA|nr:hypothetical protein GOP47_0004985 [Adiantum capillus-veneris]
MAETCNLCNFLVSRLMLLINGNRGEEVTEDTVAEATGLICRPGAAAPKENYDVFLNHRGPDVKKSFVDHLSASFEASGIPHCFVDYKSIHSGEENWDAIEHAIHHSKVHIAIFSPDYAASPWCLRELVNILECRSSGRSQLFLPVFFNVCPSDLRHINYSASCKSCYSSAFRKHKHAGRNDSQEIQKWMNALKEASNVHGKSLLDTAQGYEARLVKLIVSEVLHVLNRTILYIAKHPVGVDEKLQLALDLMQIDKAQKGFHKLGIYGMGGVGKTTLAKSIYNAIYRKFDCFHFIEGVRSEARTDAGLRSVQERMLGALLKSKETIHSISHGKEMLIEHLSDLKILLILDDVDDKEQLEALLPFDSLKDGSQIVITTRDEQIVSLAKAHKRLGMQGLNESHSHLLFNWHAFLCQEEPSEDFKALAGKVVHACDGLPLALETLGAHLYGQDMGFWEATVKVLEGHRHTLIPAQRKVTEILRISFNGLGRKDRLMFLDIACFMLGEHEDRAKRLWCSELGHAAVLYLNELRLKSLVKIDEERNLTMHDLLRDMGREIVVERSHENVWECSHLWHEDDVRFVLQHEKGTSSVRGVKLLTLEEGREEWGVKSFAGMDSLRFLLLSGNAHITGDFSLFPKELRWFQWHRCPLEFLPSQLLSKVVVLDLSKSQISSLSQGGHMFEVVALFPMASSEKAVAPSMFPANYVFPSNFVD